MQISQPAVTRTLSRLAAIGLVKARRSHRDQRQKTISLSAAGETAILRSKLLVWPQIEAAVSDMLGGLAGPLVEQLAAVESRLNELPLSHRALSMPAPSFSIRDYTDDLARAFPDINVQWIESMYSVEPADLDVLDHPRERIIDAGGVILFVEAQGAGVIGTCALRKTGEAEFELTKMGVLEAARELKAAEFLLRAAIDRAQTMGAKRLYLLSNRKSAAAIHLYEKLGFVHDSEIMRTFGARYKRCDVAMRFPLPETSSPVR